MDRRETFLSRAHDEHWEFSSLRRAKYSSICFCHALHNQEKSEGLAYQCNNCNAAAVWHCSTCEVSCFFLFFMLGFCSVLFNVRVLSCADLCSRNGMFFGAFNFEATFYWNLMCRFAVSRFFDNFSVVAGL